MPRTVPSRVRNSQSRSRTERVDRNALLFLAVPSVFTPHFFVKCVDRNIRGELPVLDRKYCVAQKGVWIEMIMLEVRTQTATVSCPLWGARIEM